MGFVPTTGREAAENAVNLSGLAIIPLGLLDADIACWYARISDKDAPPSVTRSIASRFHDRANRTAALARSTSEAMTNGLRTHETEQLLVLVAARYALSRLLGALVPDDQAYADGSETFRGTVESKILIEVGLGGTALGAFDVIVNKNTLAAEPLNVTLKSSADKQWYFRL